jgi:hypothetical protein
LLATRRPAEVRRAPSVRAAPGKQLPAQTAWQLRSACRQTQACIHGCKGCAALVARNTGTHLLRHHALLQLHPALLHDSLEQRPVRDNRQAAATGVWISMLWAGCACKGSGARCHRGPRCCLCMPCARHTTP